MGRWPADLAPLSPLPWGPRAPIPGPTWLREWSLWPLMAEGGPGRVDPRGTAVCHWGEGPTCLSEDTRDSPPARSPAIHCVPGSHISRNIRGLDGWERGSKSSRGRNRRRVSGGSTPIGRTVFKNAGQSRERGPSLAPKSPRRAFRGQILAVLRENLLKAEPSTAQMDGSQVVSSWSGRCLGPGGTQ